MILALVIAGVSLPIGIIGFNRKSIVNNYYIYNYGDNKTESDIYYAPESVTYLNLTGRPEWFHYRAYNLTNEYVISWYANRSYGLYIFINIIQDDVFDLWNESRSADLSFMILYTTNDAVHWHVEFSDTWHIYFRYNHDENYSGMNATITTIINKI